MSMLVIWSAWCAVGATIGSDGDASAAAPAATAAGATAASTSFILPLSTKYLPFELSNRACGETLGDRDRLEQPERTVVPLRSRRRRRPAWGRGRVRAAGLDLRAGGADERVDAGEPAGEVL